MELSSQDVYSDGSPCTGRVRPEHVACVRPDALALSRTRSPARRFQPNPPASEAHLAETGAPWRIEAEELIARELAKDDVEIQEKRVKRLGMQTAEGIREAYGISVDFALLSTLIKAAFAQAASATPVRVDREVKLALSSARDDRERMEQLTAFLKSVLRYDLAAVLRLLAIRLPAEDSPFKPASPRQAARARRDAAAR